MSTRSRVGMVLPDGKVKSIYIHWDGYPEGVGKILREHYTSPKDIEALLELGDLSSLGTWYDEESAKKSWDFTKLTDEEREKYSALTVPYSSRGEDCPARIDENEGEFASKLGKCWEDYTYLFKEDYSGVYCWHVCDTPYFRVLGEEDNA